MKFLVCRLPAHFAVESEHPENSMMPVELAIICQMIRDSGASIELLDLESETISLENLTKKVQGDYDYIVLRAKTPSVDVVKSCFINTKAKIIGLGHLFTTKAKTTFEIEGLNLLCAIKGEADTPFKKLLEAIKNDKALNEVPNLIFKQNEELIETDNILLDNLDELPSPAYDLFANQNYYTFYPVSFGVKKNYGFMMTSRGCPYSCSFCSPTLRNSFGKGMRFFSNDRIVKDLKNLKSLGKTIVYFRDDIFTVNRQRTLDLCERLIKENIGIKWCAQTHINNIDKELLSKMKQAGCESLGFGLESGSKKILKNIIKTNKIDRAPELIRFAKRIGLKTVCFFLVGCPEEDHEDQKLTLDLLKATMPNLIQVAYFTPYPGSTDYERFIENKDEYDFNLHHYNNYQINYTKVSREDVIKFQKKLYKTWLYHPGTLINLSLSLLSDCLFNFSFFKTFLTKGFQHFLSVITKESPNKAVEIT